MVLGLAVVGLKVVGSVMLGLAVIGLKVVGSEVLCSAVLGLDVLGLGVAVNGSAVVDKGASLLDRIISMILSLSSPHSKSEGLLVGFTVVGCIVIVVIGVNVGLGRTGCP